MNFILDTNIVLHYLGGNKTVKDILKSYKVFKNNRCYISIVSVGELLSIVYQRNWGVKRISEFENLLEKFIIIPLKQMDILKRYAEIDAYSQGKLTGRPLKGSARNMGKNDLWIAATTSVSDATLITTDFDFKHLHQVYINLITIEL